MAFDTESAGTFAFAPSTASITPWTGWLAPTKSVSQPIIS